MIYWGLNSYSFGIVIPVATLRNAIKSFRSCGSRTPKNGIRLPGMKRLGLASKATKRALVPDDR